MLKEAANWQEARMARTSARERPERECVLQPEQKLCPACGAFMRIRYENDRTLVTLTGPVRLRLKIRRCETDGCVRHHHPYRPEAEGAIALPQHEFGLDVIALAGVLRHRDHRSVPEIHRVLGEREVAIAERSVTNLLDRYDELLSTSLSDSRRLRRLLAKQGRVILALDGLQPDVGHEVLWVVRDCLSGEVLLARSLLSGTAADLVLLLREAADAVGVPVVGVISDGQTSIRRAVERALPGVPHQLCHFHVVARHRAGLPVGAQGGPHPERPCCRGCRDGAAPLRRTGRCHGPAPRQRGQPQRSHRPLLQGDPQLPPRAVPLLRCLGSAAHQQRPRT